MPTPSRHRIAVVEDSPELRADLVEFLELKGFLVRGFESAEAFFAAWPAERFDLLLLDVVLPGATGFEVAKRVRAQDDTAGIVMLTALDANGDHVTGLDAGADIYLSKRSSLEVIEAACNSVLRRLSRSSGAAEPIGDDAWRLEVRHWRLEAPNGTSVDLTHAEVVLLSTLFDVPGQVVSREALLVHLGKRETLSSLRNLDNAASRLRRKVQAVCGIELPVRPSYSKGYTFTGQCEVRA